MTKAGPIRWRLAGRLATLIPQVRGSDRIMLWARGRTEVTGRIDGCLVNGIRFEFDDASDPTVSGLLHLQYVAPALAPVLEAALSGGDCFYDVGANIGLYSVWAARIVGPSGRVLAFEPASSSRDLLERFARLNRIENIEVIPSAVGAEEGDVWLHFDAGSSAQAHITTAPSTLSVQVPMIRLDDMVDGPAPTLMKIDVEGYELQVFEGGGVFVKRHRPMIVFEVIASHLGRNGNSYAEIYRWLSTLDYQLYDLTQRGLRPSVVERPTGNVLALCEDLVRHADVKRRLAKTRFARNQTL